MSKIAELVSKLNLLGDKPQVLEDDSAIVYVKNKEAFIGFRINAEGKVEESPFNINGFVPGTDQFLDAELKNNTYILDRHLKQLLKFSSERPVKIIDDYFIALVNPISSITRLIDIQGEPITKHLSWGTSIYRIQETDRLVVKSGHSSGIDIILAIKNGKSEVITCVTDLDTVNIGAEYFTVRYKQRNKLIMYDYSGKIMLSIPSGKTKLYNGKIILTDKVDKLVTCIVSAEKIL